MLTEDRGQRTASSHLHTDTSRPLSFFWKQLGSLSSSPSAILASLSRTSSYSSGSSFSQYLLIWSPIPREDTWDWGWGESCLTSAVHLDTDVSLVLPVNRSMPCWPCCQSLPPLGRLSLAAYLGHFCCQVPRSSSEGTLTWHTLVRRHLDSVLPLSRHPTSSIANTPTLFILSGQSAGGVFDVWLDLERISQILWYL